MKIRTWWIEDGLPFPGNTECKNLVCPECGITTTFYKVVVTGPSQNYSNPRPSEYSTDATCGKCKHVFMSYKELFPGYPEYLASHGLREIPTRISRC